MPCGPPLQQAGPTEIAPAARRGIEAEFAEPEHVEAPAELAPDGRLAHPGRPGVVRRRAVVAEQDKSQGAGPQNMIEGGEVPLRVLQADGVIAAPVEEE